MHLHIIDEISRLRAVILGTAESNGPTPKLEDAYDPKSAEHIKAEMRVPRNISDNTGHCQIPVFVHIQDILSIVLRNIL